MLLLSKPFLSRKGRSSSGGESPHLVTSFTWRSRSMGSPCVDALCICISLEGKLIEIIGSPHSHSWEKRPSVLSLTPTGWRYHYNPPFVSESMGIRPYPRVGDRYPRFPLPLVEKMIRSHLGPSRRAGALGLGPISCAIGLKTNSKWGQRNARLAAFAISLIVPTEVPSWIAITIPDQT